jgi:uncharacterized membrane protein (UPF0127 family)
LSREAVNVVPAAISWVTTLATFSALLLGVAALPHQQAAILPTTTIAIGGIAVSVEIADEPAERAQGLSERAGLAPGTGMLFVFPQSSPRSFWMKDMRFCLDLVWIESGLIQGATTNVCPTKVLSDADLPTYSSPVPVTYVLEAPAGWLSAHGLAAGTPVENLPSPSAN